MVLLLAMDSWFLEEIFSEWNGPFDCIFHVVVVIVVVSHHALPLLWFTIVTSFIWRFFCI